MKKIIFLLLLLVPPVLILSAQNKKYVSPRVAFYNVENLFDTVDHPTFADEDFTPNGKQKWTNERYQAKLNNIARVIEDMEFPAFLGLCEVENRLVLEDLAALDQLKAKKYSIVHQESPDFRGIDVAFLYNKKAFKLKEYKVIRIKFPPAIVENYTTRDILMVKGKYKKQDLYFFINHWPSRRGGLKESEPKRTYVAQQLKNAVDSLFALDSKANIIIMGDFNDETDNNSVAKTLNAQSNPDNIVPAQLYNCFAAKDKKEEGSYNYRGTLNMLDQIIVSSTLMSKEGLNVSNPVIFKAEWMIFKHKRYGDTPNRTYGGPNYYGGTSDHFPVYVDLK